MPPDSKSALSLDRARRLHSDGRLAEAEQAYLKFAKQGPQREAALAGLANLYLQARRVREAVATFVELTNEAADNFSYFARLATLFDTIGQTDSAIETYERFLNRRPELSTAWFNIALLYKKQRRFAEAVSAYERAIRSGIDRPHEVYSNLGVLFAEMHQPDRAKRSFERALGIDATYIPAIFNLAGLLEESGDRQEAATLYERILGLDPEHGEALARLGYLRRVTDAADPLIKAIRDATLASAGDPLGREALFFALGKVLDDVHDYEAAFRAYRSANELGHKRVPPYDRGATEHEIEQLIEVFSADRIASISSRSDAAPIFICGMFRSGSTLVEQILAAHPAVTAGGELDFLPWIVANRLAPYPRSVDRLAKQQVHELAEEYVLRSRDLFPDARQMTDKRPDNFRHLGLIKAMFPDARIVYTLRNIQDNCLSVYFQQLGADLNYATDLDNIAHFYAQHERLMRHWQSCMGENILPVNYDELVRSPEPILRRLLDFLGLDWHDGCLQFHQTQGLVKTASIWQVREELHARSSGRWQNYASYAREISQL